MVPGEGLEPPTNGLQNRCSTAELTRQRLPLWTLRCRGQEAKFATGAIFGASVPGFFRCVFRHIETLAQSAFLGSFLPFPRLNVVSSTALCRNSTLCWKACRHSHATN